MAEGAAAFTAALLRSGNMMPLIADTLLLVGALLLANRFVPLALVPLAPFLVNAVAFHVFVEPAGRGAVAVFAALELYLAWAYRDWYRALFVARTAPAGPITPRRSVRD